MNGLVDFCIRVAEISNGYEKSNNNLKRQYIANNIMLYNDIVNMVEGNYGSFGTGYPFYVLDSDLLGKLPVISEQLRYNNELIEIAMNSCYMNWHCSECLEKSGNCMPDLKQICKPCPNMNDGLKPRKILNRLPDIDMWMICDKSKISEVIEKLSYLFSKYDMHTSDVNPSKTIFDLAEIVSDLESGVMPNKKLPIDVHIIDYDTLYFLISEMPNELEKSNKEGNIPYLPIHPLSYRKTWQYDDMPYNFVHDYLSSLTEYNFESNLKEKLYETRKLIANTHSFDELYQCLLETGGQSVKERHKEKVLKYRFKERIESWKN